MAVAVVQIGRVRMRVLDPVVHVRMAVRLDRARLVRVPMVLVMDVEVLGLDGLVHVRVRVLLAQQQQAQRRAE